jgi:hypothetical protein
MNKIFFFTLLFLNSFLLAEAVKVDSAELEFIRHKFYLGIEDEDQVDTLESYLVIMYGRDFNNIDPVITAYYGAIEALRGKHAFFPFTKLSYVNSSQEILAKAIEQKPYNLEIRFLRFSILHHIPGILGYSREREEDKNIIFNLLKQKDYSQLNIQRQEGIIEFMISSDRLSEEQTEELLKLTINFTLK